MDRLYDEAVWCWEYARLKAREALQLLCSLGFDVTQPIFAGRVKLSHGPKHGYVGLWFMGDDENLMVPPYEEQARRLLARYDILRDRMYERHARILPMLEAANRDFLDAGELPADEVLRDCVLAMTEYLCLLQTSWGEDRAAFLTAFDEAAQTTGATREAAIARVQGMVRGTQLLSDEYR
jgi:hypothetical protein